MRRGWKILIAVLVALLVLLVVNAFVSNQQTKPAGVTVDGGKILSLPGGDLQVQDIPAAAGRQEGAPIVLLHGLTGSLHWWDQILPRLNRTHRVIRIDLLGFGGSEKPRGGYSMENQGRLVATALAELHVQGAVVVGHSMGFDVATALADQSSELVDRVVNIDEGPDPSYADIPFVAKLTFVPLIGQALWRTLPDFAIKDAYKVAFAPGYDMGDFGNVVVDGFRAQTYTSFSHSSSAEDDYENAIPLDERIRSATVPLLVIFGAEDQTVKDPQAAAQAYRTVPGAQVSIIKGAGHSPIVEKPAETARLLLDFAAQAHVPAKPKPHAQRAKRHHHGGQAKKPAHRRHAKRSNK